MGADDGARAYLKRCPQYRAAWREHVVRLDYALARTFGSLAELWSGTARKLGEAPGRGLAHTPRGADLAATPHPIVRALRASPAPRH